MTKPHLASWDQKGIFLSLGIYNKGNHRKPTLQIILTSEKLNAKNDNKAKMSIPPLVLNILGSL